MSTVEEVARPERRVAPPTVSRAGSPRVSVVMPARNEARFIARALRSLQRQTLRDIEMVVVDDHSSDDTAAIVRRLAADDRRVRLLRNPGRGFVEALNHGLGQASADVIARLDADDWSLRRRLERQLAELQTNPKAVAVGTHGWRVNEAGIPVGRLRTGPVGRDGYRQAMADGYPVNLTHSSAMFRRRAVERVGGYSSEYHPADDLWLWNCLATLGEVYAVPQSLTMYTLRTSCMSVDDAVEMHVQIKRVWQALGRGGGVSRDDPRVRREAEALSARRHVARCLANGRLWGAWRAARRHGEEVGSLQAFARRALSG